MPRKIHHNIAHRFAYNPIFTLADMPFAVSDIHNAGCIAIDGVLHLLITVEHLQGDHAIYHATTTDRRSFRMHTRPLLSAEDDGACRDYEAQGMRDARITRIGRAIYITYLAQSRHGFRLALAEWDGADEVRRMGCISEPDTKNGALFPQKIDGRYARLERPREGGNIWISYSHDLMHWGDWRMVMHPRHGYWDFHRIGAAAPPILTDRGWLLLYYGARNLREQDLYRLGAAFLDHADPTRVIGRSNVPILAPREHYERIGDTPNILFCCGALLSGDGESLEVIYGAADSCICMATVEIDELMHVCFRDHDGENQ
jgi:predicted GH43/DUF377 family glycosyl hydrolase